MDILTRITDVAARCNFDEYGYIGIEKLKYYPEVRKICEGNMCRNYGTSWACPPATGTIEECMARVSQYDKMLLFSHKYELEDSYDFDGMVAGLSDFKQKADMFHQNLNGLISDFLMLSNEGCGRCSQCTYPDSPCRFPHLLHHSLEGYGFIVSELAAQAGIRYNNGINTVTYFGALIFCENEAIR